MDEFHQAMNKEIGVGGWKCPCCNPMPSGSHRGKRGRVRASLHRHARRRMKNTMLKQIRREDSSD
jgi:hypothetical protein